MKDEDQAEQSTTYNPFKQPQQSNLRNALLDKHVNEKKKKNIGWDRIRENVGDFHHSDGTIFDSTPASSTTSTPSSSRSNTPKLVVGGPASNSHTPHKKQHLNPFLRGQFSESNLLGGHNDSRSISLANTTLVAAQVAGMTNFNRQFRAGATHHNKNGGIYATSTAVQQDIYKLERNLDKILQQLNSRSQQHGTFADSNSSLGGGDSSLIMPPPPPPATHDKYNYISHNYNSTSGKKSVFQRQSMADLFNNNSSSTTNIDALIHHDEVHHSDVTRISSIMTSIMESIVKHKAATRLPLTGEILAVLSVPFDKSPLIESDCAQALDLFDYIRDRFKLLDSSEQFERILFCCRLLGSGEMKSKKRVLGILNTLLEPCIETPDYLPSTPTAYHSLVYTLTNALAQVDIHHKYENNDIMIHEGHPVDGDVDKDQQYMRTGIMDILDKLAYGKLIPIVGEDWKLYHSQLAAHKIPAVISQLCVVEGLLKSIMTGVCIQSDPYKGVAEPSDTNSAEGTRGKLVLQELLSRYWLEPEVDARPAYFKIIFLLTELACDTFLMASVDDLKLKTSVVSLLIPLVVDKLSPSKLQGYLSERNTNETGKMVSHNVITMLLCLLSVCSLEESQEQPSSAYSSPKLSPRPSMPDFASSEIGNLSPRSIVQDRHSISSFNVNIQSDAAMKNLLLTLKGYIEEFWSAGYKDFILAGTESMHQDVSGERAARCFQNLVFHIDPAIGEEIVKKTLPSLFKRLVDTYPPAIPALCQMLYETSKRFRASFFKPVVSCVASDDEDKVTNQLKLITCMRRYLSGVQFWMQDAEMINVLLLSDVGHSKKQREASSASSGAASSSPSTAAQQTPQLKVNDAPHEAKWGSTTLGQCAIATEFMWAIKELRDKQKDPHRNMEEDEIAKKFLIDLERRLAVFLTAKEKMSLVPMTLRIILCNIFIDIRFFCNTTHRPGWLSRVIDWACQPVVSTPDHVFHHVLPIINPDMSPSPNNPHVESKMPVLHTGHLNDASFMFERIHCVYLNVEEQLQLETNDMNDYGGFVPKTGSQQHTGALIPTDDADLVSEEVPRHKRHQFIHAMYPISRSAAQSLDLNPPPISDSGSNGSSSVTDGPALKLAKYRFEHMEKINQDPFGSVFSLLAAVFTTLSSQEFGRLIKPLWERHTDDRKPQSFIPAAFLLMECGEKIPKTMIEVTTHDFYSGDPLRRLAVILKHSSLSAFRFNVLGQEYIPISSRRRPFRGDGGAFSTPFVPTDLGSNQFTLDEPRWMAKLKNASNFPIELKRQIQELGWDDDENVDEHEALKKVLTPLALLPSLFLEEEDERMNEDENPSIAPARHNGKPINISKIITRRKRATTIHSLTVSFLSMVDLLNDDYGGASNSLRELLEYFLRDDPAVFLRSFLNDLGKYKLDRHKDMLTRLRYLVSMQHKLPPGFTHVLFNYLAGMLKWLMRENKKDGLVLMTLIHPLLAELTLSTNDLSIRDLRKNKIEHLLVSTGRFWFTHEQPSEMFPRYLSNNKTPFSVLDIPPEIFSVAMLRISHIQFLTNYLVRYPREVYAVKKTLQDYEPTPIPGANLNARWTMEETHYPDITRHKQRETNSYLYNEEVVQGMNTVDEDEVKAIREASQQQLDTEMLAALRARIWLRFVDNLLNGLNKNYNDRNELERILQGINAIITEHDRDFGIIGQALILYTRVVTRFKRLFISNRGYTTFLSPLFKVFCEVDSFPQVRSAIIFAWCRFYAVHEESFVFQMLGTLVPTILNGYTKSAELGDWMIDNLFILMQAMHDPPHLGATSDILGLQLQVELDDHERSIQERIDAASNPMAIPLSTAILKPLARSVTAPIAPLDVNNYNNKPFELQNFIKLFLTIIAYDPGSLRAEQFVKIFRHMIPRFEKLSILKDLVDEGISALVDVLAKFSKNAKPIFSTNNPQTNANGYQGVSSGGFDGAPGVGIGGAGNARTESAQHAYGKQWQQNDRLTVKKEFVLLVHEHLKHGGSLGEVAHEKMAQIIRIVMQNYGSIKGYICSTDWIKNYLVDSFHSMAEIRNYTKSYKKMLNLIFSQYRVLWKTMDAADIYDGLAIVLEEGKGQPMYMHDIAGVMNEKFVSFGLTAATRHNWENDTKGHAKYCNALVRLIIAIMENSTQDVLGEIEQQNPTPGLIGNIIIPICLQYNLQWDYSNMPMSGKFRPDPTSNWTRLLNYISRACSQASLMKSKSSGFSLAQLTSSTSGQDNIDAAEFPDYKDRKQTPQSVALLFSLSFVAMKIILVRGSKSFDKLKGSWVQVAFFIRTALVFGQTLKFLKPKSGKSTPHNVASPSTSNIPLTPSALSPGVGNWTGSSNDNRATFSFSAPLSTGTIYDFITWRFLEFVTCFKSPLLLFLKDFIQEKLIDMGGSSTNNRSPLYSPLPSPGVSMNFGSRVSPVSGREGGITRWKSWGGGSSTTPPLRQQRTSPPPQTQHGIIPQLNIQDADSLSISLNTTTDASSPICGLGLHIPGKASFSSSGNTSPSVPPIPSSPSLSMNPTSEVSDNEGSIPAVSIHSPKFSLSIKNNKKDASARPSFSTTTDAGLFTGGGATESSSTVLHVLHAESITSIVHVQLSMGFKPALPWMAAQSRRQLKPWNNREAVAKLSSEWQLLLQLYAEADLSAVKMQSQNMSNSNIPSTPLM